MASLPNSIRTRRSHSPAHRLLRPSLLAQTTLDQFPRRIPALPPALAEEDHAAALGNHRGLSCPTTACGHLLDFSGQPGKPQQGVANGRIVVLGKVGQEVVTQAISGKSPIQVRSVLPIGLANPIQVFEQVGAARAQQWPDEGHRSLKRAAGIPASPAIPVPRRIRCRTVSI